MTKRCFVFYFHYTNWRYFSLGFHIDFSSPNFEIHLPSGFIKIGITVLPITKPHGWDIYEKLTFGAKGSYK